ncbi:IDEAL domain-containing protein [Rossellomorea sp. RS05]|uniref:IDEAL domain-containing protein n=1 Tax=Rossellomorea sp. RS05 TaxID=3149166 RepID=UPI003221EA3F
MENKKSYTDMMKASAMTRKKHAEKSVLDIYIDMVIHESILTTRRADLLEAIDAALDCKDENLFMKLTDELTLLSCHYG